MTDLVSVIMPAYNSAAFIERTLVSVLGQTHRNLEVIVVDDGSTDATLAIVEELAKRDDRVRLVRSTYSGVPASRNLAAAHATGAFMAPCDSDDLWRADKIALQLAALKDRPEIGAVNCWSVGIDEDDMVIAPDWARHEAKGDVLHAMIENSLPGSGSALLFRRSCFEAVGGYPPNVPNGDEWHLFIALAGVCQFALVREELVGYRLRRGSISNNFHQVEESLATTTAWLLEKWPQTPPDLLRRRQYFVQRYLAFVAIRNGFFAKAVGFQIGAWRARPRLVSLVEFGWLVVSRMLGIERYYYRFWRRPVRWSTAI